MKSILLILCMQIGAIGIHAQYNEQNLALEPVRAVARYKYENLQLFPIRASSTFATEHKSVGNYVTLKEALEKKKIAITEAGEGTSGGTVNTLFIENISRDTILILGGEVVQGGKQDRMIATDFLLYPGSGKKDISVFCVEHGRWQTKADGKSFNECFSISSNDVRKAGTVKKDQREVWSKVADITNKNNAGSSTGTLTALKESESYNSELKKYLIHFKDLLGGEEDVIGMVAVSGDKILGCDMFATHGLFKSHYANLLNSYATEAISTGKTITIQYDKVKEYLQAILKDETNQEKEIPKNGTLLKDGKNKIHISTF
jgi:hypothetical protein